MEELRERGRDLPKRYVNQPLVDPALQWFYEAFWRLSPDRQSIGGFDRIIYTGIPFSAIDCYARRYGIKGAIFDIFIALVKALDGTFLEIRNGRYKIADEIEPDDSDYVKMLFGIMEVPEPTPPSLPPPTTEVENGSNNRDDTPAPNSRRGGRSGARRPAAKRPRRVDGERRKGKRQSLPLD